MFFLCFGPPSSCRLPRNLASLLNGLEATIAELEVIGFVLRAQLTNRVTLRRIAPMEPHLQGWHPA